MSDKAKNAVDRPEQYHHAARAYREGDLIAAQRLCQEALVSVPACADALYLLGVIAFDNSDDDTAIDWLERSISVSASRPRSYLYLAAACHRSNALSAALAAALKALELAPELAGVHLQLGLIYQSQHELDTAEAAYRQGLRLDPDSIRLHELLGTVLHQSGHFAEAVVAYRTGLAIDTQQASLHNNLGSALHQHGEFEAATQAYEKALALAPDNAEYRYNLGVNLECRGQLSDAMVRYREAAQLDAHSSKALLALARIHDQRDEPQDAVNAYQASIRRQPRCREAHLGLANILVDAQKLEQAKVCYENILLIEPKDMAAHEGLADLYRDLGQVDESIRYYRVAKELGSIAAGHFLAALTHEASDTAPRQYVEELFDSYSDNFDKHLIDSLSYQVPRRLFEAFTYNTHQRGLFRHALDLGCGTGLAGKAFQSVVERIDGVDLSSDMLEKAREKSIYTELHVMDVVEFLREASNHYDLFIATDVLIYIGKLEGLFQAVSRRASIGAYFVFSTESAECPRFELRSSGRYAHAQAYINLLAQAYGFSVQYCEALPLRKESEAWIDGQVFILRYRAAK